MNSHSRSSSGPGLPEDLVRHGELAEIVQLCGARELVKLVAAQTEHPPGLDRERRDALRVGLKPRLAFRERSRGGRAWSRPCLARREYFCAYSRSSTRRNASLASVASSGSTIAPNELEISNPSPRSDKALHARSMSGSASPMRDVRDEAELVASETIRRTVLTGNRRELRTEAGEQRVSRRVAEAVVVALEAVQVEDHQENWTWGDPRRVGSRDPRRACVDCRDP